jgi:hypothetical protein
MDLKKVLKFGCYVILNLILINSNLRGQDVKVNSNSVGVNNDDFMKFKDNNDIINTFKFKIFSGDKGLIKKSQSKNSQDWEYKFVQGNYIIEGKKSISFEEVKSDEGELLRIDTTVSIYGRVDWLYPKNNKEFETLRSINKCNFSWTDSPIKSEVKLFYRVDNSQLVYSSVKGRELVKNECKYFEEKHKGNFDDLTEFRVQNIFIGNGFEGRFNIKGDTLDYLQFKDGLKNGKFESKKYNRDFKKYFIVSSGSYSLGKENGIFLKNDEYGFKVEETKYNLGIRVYEKRFHLVTHQRFFDYSDHKFPSSIMVIRNYDSKGQEHGINQFYYYPKVDENGNRLSEIGVLQKIETMEHGYNKGEHIEYFDNGKVKIRGIYLSQFQKVGVWEEFDYEGNLISKEDFISSTSKPVKDWKKHLN